MTTLSLLVVALVVAVPVAVALTFLVDLAAPLWLRRRGR